MLEITNYKKTYGNTTVLEISHLQLSEGIYWLKGENGAGKTTFIKSVAGLIPFEGIIVTDGLCIRKQRMLYTKKVSFAEAEPVYPSFLTGNDLVQFYRNTKGETSCKALAEAFGVVSYLQNKTGTYSSGMLKKLSLLLAFSDNPKLILLDEPFITLDAAAVIALHQRIALSFSKGISFIISSHQQLELSVPYHTLKINQQTIEQELYAVPAE